MLWTLQQDRMLDVIGARTLAFWWQKTSLTILLPQFSTLQKNPKNLYHMDFCASCVFHTNVLLPSFLFHPPSGRVVVRRGFVASSSRAWCWITWLPPTTLALPSCHQGNVSILTNMPWHLWPSSPICDPISFSHFISPLLYWDSDCSHYYFIFSDHHHLFLPNQFVMPCVPW